MCGTQTPPETFTVELTNLELIELTNHLQGWGVTSEHAIPAVVDKLQAIVDDALATYPEAGLEEVAQRQAEELASAHA